MFWHVQPEDFQVVILLEMTSGAGIISILPKRRERWGGEAAVYGVVFTPMANSWLTSMCESSVTCFDVSRSMPVGVAGRLDG